MKIEIKKGKANGTVQAPPSKSIAHRMLICAGLSAGESVIYNIAPSGDILATIDCLKALGADICYENRTAKIKGTDLNNLNNPGILDCRECGSTLRFFIPICLLTGKKITLKGSEKLFSRPLEVYKKICGENGFLFDLGKNSLTVCGKLESGEYEVAGNISSQFISGLLFALSLAGGESIIKIIPPVESRPYIDMTVSVLEKYGSDIKFTDDKTIHIKGGKKYTPCELSVEGDYSNGAFLDVFNCFGGKVAVEGLSEYSLQGDKVYKKYFRMLKSGFCEVDLSDCPDLGPVCMAAAAGLNGAFFTGTKRLRIKESDRCEAMAEELSKLGVKSEIEENTMKIYGGMLRKPEEVLYGHNDHRIVMALTCLLTITGGRLKGAEAVNKSFPDFFEKLSELGVEVNKIGMDK